MKYPQRSGHPDQKIIFARHTGKKTLCYPVFVSGDSVTSVINGKEYTKDEMEKKGYRLVPKHSIPSFEILTSQEILQSATEGMEEMYGMVFYNLESGFVIPAYVDADGLAFGIKATKKDTLTGLYEKGYRLISCDEKDALESIRKRHSGNYICRNESERALKVNYDIVTGDHYVVKDRTRVPLNSMLEDGWRLIPAREGIRWNRRLV